MTYMTIWGVVVGLVMAGWILWALREYSRTSKVWWLWMAGVMALGLLGTLAQLRAQ
ncbi:MAG: hypothetical protein ACOYEV_07695 [Candidatus Nanopelagicales bacterium]